MNATTRTTYHIGELAERSGLTPDTLRYYERLGLIRAPRRTSGGFRVYSTETLERLRFIKQAQTVGLTLREIQDLVSYRDQGGVRRCQRVHDLLQAKVSDLEAKLAELQEFRQTLRHYLDECEHALATRREPECPVIEELQVKGS